MDGSKSLNGNITQMAIVGDALSDTVVKLQETAVASGAVIGHRLTMALAAAVDPANADHAEFQLMTTEKVEGFSQSANATIGGLLDIQASMLHTALDHATRTTAAMVEAGTAFWPTGAAHAQKRWLDDSLSVAQAHSWDVANKLVDLSALALDPLHSRATDNAKRLGQVGKIAAKKPKT